MQSFRVGVGARMGRNFLSGPGRENYSYWRIEFKNRKYPNGNAPCLAKLTPNADVTSACTFFVGTQHVSLWPHAPASRHQQRVGNYHRHLLSPSRGASRIGTGGWGIERLETLVLKMNRHGSAG